MMVGELQNRDAAHAGSSIVMALILLLALYSFLASRRYFISGKQILQKATINYNCRYFETLVCSELKRESRNKVKIKLYQISKHLR